MVVVSDEFGDFKDSKFGEEYSGVEKSWGPALENFTTGEVFLGVQGKFDPAKDSSSPHSILINGGQSEDNQTITFSHEGYGHAYFFTKGENIENWAHKYEKEMNPETLRYERVDRNEKLDEHIKKVENFTRQFLNKRKAK